MVYHEADFNIPTDNMTALPYRIVFTCSGYSMDAGKVLIFSTACSCADDEAVLSDHCVC